MACETQCAVTLSTYRNVEDLNTILYFQLPLLEPVLRAVYVRLAGGRKLLSVIAQLHINESVVYAAFEVQLFALALIPATSNIALKTLSHKSHTQIFKHSHKSSSNMVLSSEKLLCTMKPYLVPPWFFFYLVSTPRLVLGYGMQLAFCFFLFRNSMRPVLSLKMCKY